MGANTNVNKEEVIRLHKTGMKDSHIAKQIGCSAARVYNILVEKGLKKKRIDKGKVWALYRAGWSLDMISDEMSCDEERITEILNAV